MNITELDSFNLADTVKFHDRLNPRLWDRSEHLRSDVREKLLEIARDFQEFLGVPDLDVKDITVSGSNAAYNYTNNSDIDLHLVVDLPEADNSEVYRELFDAKKFQYNNIHNIKIGGYDVELYVQNPHEEHHSQGIYSLLRNAWISVPRRRRAEIDDISTRSKYEDLAARIDSTVKSGDHNSMATLMKKIKGMRQSGLEKQGEFGSDNLAFKLLRNNGYIKKLVDARNAARDRELSLAELAKPRQRVTYGFMKESPDGVDPTTKMFLEEPVDESPDGVNPTTAMFVTEDDHESTVREFIDFVADRLGITQMPAIELHTDPEWSKQNKSFGRYTPETHTLEVNLANRHIMDILRTTAHELVHCRQNQERQLPNEAGATGSKWENQAHAIAGVIMRDYADHNPKMFENASGYIPKNKKEARDPRYSMAVSVDIKPGQVGKEANKLALNTGRNGEPGLLMKSANLRESFDQPYPLTWERAEHGIDAFTRLPDGTPLSIMFNDEYDHDGNEITQVEFHRNNSQSVTGEGDAQRIFATVLSAIQQFINDERPKRITFAADKEEGPSRASLYKKLVERFARPLGYQVETHEAGTSLYFDLTRRWGLREVELAESLRQEFELFEEQDLFEINMSPSSLKAEAAKTGAMAGMEFEMIVPNIKDDGGDLEPDYDQDERVRDIDDAVNFFDDGEYNDRYSIRSLRDQMYEDFWTWRSEQADNDWWNSGDGFDYFKDYLDREDAFDAEEAEEEARNQLQSEYGDELDVEEFEKMLFALVDEKREAFIQEQWDDQGRYFDDAREEYTEERVDDYSEQDWLESQGIRYASDVESNYGNVTWPYYTSTSSGEGDIQQVADEFSSMIGKPVNSSTSYHGAKRAPGTYVVEPDGSLDPDDSDDMGLEFVSPPMPIDEMISDLNKVKAWAGRTGCYTNDSTGLHINISVPDFDLQKLDYVKLALLLGDKYVLDQYGRSSNTYAASALGKVQDLVKRNPDSAKQLLDKMRGHMEDMATKVIHSGTTSKYTSINTKTGYIEFRSPGGDWLDENFDKIENTLMRFTVALSAAMNPEAYREEYLKKLYKLLEPTAVESNPDTIRYFADYVAGKTPKAALRSFVKQAQLQRKLKKDQAKGEKYWWEVSNPGQSYASVEVVASTQEEAIEKALGPDGYPSWANTRNTVVAKPLRPYEEKSAGTQLQAQGQPIWAIVSKANPSTVIQTVVGNKESAVRQYGIWIDAETERNFVDYDLVPYTQELRDGSQAARAQVRHGEHNWAIRRRSDGTVIRTFQANNYMQAFDYLQQYKQDHNITNDDLTYGPYTPVRGEPGAGSDVELNGRPSNPDGDFVIVDTNNDDKPVYRYRAADSGDAITVLRQWIAANPGTEWTYRYDPNKDLGQPGRQPAQQTRTGINYEIFRGMDRDDIVAAFVAADDQAAMERLARYRETHPGAEYNADRAPIPGSTIDLQRQRAAQASQSEREPVANIDLFPDIEADLARARAADATQRGETEYIIFNMNDRSQLTGFRAANQAEAEREAESILRDLNLDPDQYDVRERNARPIGSQQAGTTDAAQGGIVDVAGEPATGSEVGQTYNPSGTGSFTGQWLVLNPNNQVIYRFGGIGNSQSDANRLAMAWLRQNPRQMVNGVSVVPEMG